MTALMGFNETSMNPEYQQMLAKMNRNEKDTFVSLLPGSVAQQFKNYIALRELGGRQKATERSLDMTSRKHELQYGLGEKALGLRGRAQDLRAEQAANVLNQNIANQNFRYQLAQDALSDQRKSIPWQIGLGGLNVLSSAGLGYANMQRDFEEAAERKKMIRDKYGSA